MINVTTERNDYTDYLPIWQQVDDVIAGERAIKAAGVKYLPVPNPADKSKENLARYDQYKKRALFMNATSRTLNAMLGAIYRKTPNVELPPQIEYLNTDADGNGLDLVQHSAGTVKEIIKKGRAGLLVDYPATEGVTTKAQQSTGGIRPYIIQYQAQDIINWRTIKIGAVNKLSLIVLKEESEEYQDLFKSEALYNYRVLWLDNNNIYNVTTYKKDGKEMSQGETFQPKDAKGKFFNEIPFRFVGSQDNNYTIDEAPLYDLSNVNLSHYRNSADNEESSFLVGQPTLILSTDSSTEELKTNNPCGLQFGSRTAIVLGVEDSVNLLQAEPNNLPKSNMKDKEEMMVMLGARLVSATAQQTAEATRINYGAETSQLSMIVSNVDSAYQDCIRWCMMFETGTDENFVFNLNKDFFAEKMTAQDIQAWVMMMQQSIVAMPDFRQKLRESGQIADTRTDEDIEDDLEIEGALPGEPTKDEPSEEDKEKERKPNG